MEFGANDRDTSFKFTATVRKRFFCTQKQDGESMARPDRTTAHRSVFDKNKARILKTQDVCGICGKPVDKSLKFPHPLSPCIDHIIPVDKGGHPSDISNLQLAHLCCNRKKSDKLVQSVNTSGEVELISNRVLPWSLDWKKYRAKENT